MHRVGDDINCMHHIHGMRNLVTLKLRLGASLARLPLAHLLDHEMYIQPKVHTTRVLKVVSPEHVPYDYVLLACERR